MPMLGMVELASNPSVWEAEAENWGLQGHPQFETSLGDMRPCL